MTHPPTGIRAASAGTHALGAAPLDRVVVGISEMQVSDRPNDLLVTYSLGSCVGVSFYDTVARVGAMIHCMLPLSKVDPAKAKMVPHMFVDTGVPDLLKTIYEMGARSENLITKVAGAASLLDEKGLFKIGKRNHTVLRKLLWKNSILIEAEDVGGTSPRTMSLHIGTGRTYLKIKGKEEEL